MAREVGKHFEAGHYHKLPIKVRMNVEQCLRVVQSSYAYANDVLNLLLQTHVLYTTNEYQTTQVFPMSQIREALEFMKTGKHVGKVNYRY